MQPKIEIIGDANKCLPYLKWAKNQWALREGSWQKQLDTCIIYFKRNADSGYILFITKSLRLVGRLENKNITITTPDMGVGDLEQDTGLQYGNVYVTDNDTIAYSIAYSTDIVGLFEDGEKTQAAVVETPIALVLDYSGELYSIYASFIYKGATQHTPLKELIDGQKFKHPYNKTANTVLSVDTDLSFSENNDLLLVNKSIMSTGSDSFDLIRVGGFSPKLVGSYTEVGENLQYLFPIDGQNTLNKINVNQTSIYSLSGDSDAGQVTITVPTYRFCLNEWRVVFTDQTSCAVTPLEGVYYKFVDRKTYYKIRLVRTPIPTTISPIYSAAAFFGLFTQVTNSFSCGDGTTRTVSGFSYIPPGGTTYYVEYGGFIHRTTYLSSGVNSCVAASPAGYSISGPSAGDKVYTAVGGPSTSCAGTCKSTKLGIKIFVTYTMLYDAGSRCWDYPSDSYMTGLTDAEGVPVELPSEDGYYIKVYSVEEWSCE